MRCTSWMLMIIAVLLLPSCPTGSGKAGGQTKDNSASTKTVSSKVDPSSGADNAQPGGPAGRQVDVATPAAQGQASTIPDGVNWVQPVKPVVQFNRPFKVNYQLVAPNAGEAFIALVPAAVTSALLKDNVVQAVDRVTLPQGETGLIELTAHNPGTYTLRLFPAQLGEISAVAEATVTVTDQPSDSELVLTPPYVTITDRKLDKEPEQFKGRPMIAYWELAETPGADAWIGLIPTSCTAKDAASNLSAALDVQPLLGSVQDRSIFALSEVGEFVFRVFLGKDATTTTLCESQVFRVIEPPAQPAPKAK